MPVSLNVHCQIDTPLNEHTTQVCDRSETGEIIGIPDSTVWSGNWDDEKAERKEIDA